MQSANPSVPIRAFSVKKDLWLGFFIWGIVAASFAIALFPFDPSSLFMPVVISILFAFMWFGTRYKIAGDHIVVKAGPFKYTPIPVQKITSIKNTRTWLAAPALSLDRILISYGRYDEIIISPRHKKEFIAALQQINPGIQDYTKEIDQ